MTLHPIAAVRSRGFALSVLCATFLVAGLGLLLGARQDAEAVEGARELVRQRMEIERQIWKEKRDWALAEEVLTSQIELRRDEIASLREEIAKAQGDIGDADAKIAELVTEDEAARAVEAELVARITELEARAKELLPRLPEHVREKVRPLSQQFPEDPATTKLGTSVRYANLAAVMQEVVKANTEIALTSEVRELANGRSAEVTALYVGLGQGYYVTALGDAAGTGSAEGDAWRWTDANGSAEAIRRAIQVYEGEEPAAFVRLPIAVD